MSEAIISQIEPSSPAQKLGLEPGDKLISINSHSPKDVIDYQLLCEESDLRLTVLRRKKELNFSCQVLGKPLGLKFTSSIFDGLKKCHNKCLFCFIDQLPPGLRPSLYVKDDDFRLSFLYGNFITLTNLTEEELERITAQRLSPLYVSLHTTNPELHQTMLGSPRGSEGKAFIYLKRLLEANIEIHLQIVLCPGLNDGEELDKTISNLAEGYSKVKSVGIVPVGLTKYRQGLSLLESFTPQKAEGVIAQVEKWQNEFLKMKRIPWLFLADEFYLLTGRLLPPHEHYDDFPQLENGIGLSRLFLSEVEEATRSLPKGGSHPDLSRNGSGERISYTLVTATLAVPVMEEALRYLRVLGLNLSLAVVSNNFFGELVSVAGLLTASDINTYFNGQDKKNSGPILIPDVCLNSEGCFLDGLSPADLSQKINRQVVVAPSTGKKLVSFLTKGVEV